MAKNKWSFVKAGILLNENQFLQIHIWPCSVLTIILNAVLREIGWEDFENADKYCNACKQVFFLPLFKYLEK